VKRCYASKPSIHVIFLNKFIFGLMVTVVVIIVALKIGPSLTHMPCIKDKSLHCCAVF